MSYAIDLTWAPGDGGPGPAGYRPDHRIAFPGGQAVTMSAAPDYGGNAAAVNPEEAMAAALSSCHMMTFLALCTKARWRLAGYRDHAVATLGRMENGRTRIARITLNPVVAFETGHERTAAELSVMHERAHRYCFVANSLSCEMQVVTPTEGDAE
ncbi:MAG: OsmC family protein [Rubellimicrobium sp.]|nr:OsmC family protein [Rubellimicrobium sp.]